MRRERAALALFSLPRKQARPTREPDAIFENQPSAIGRQPSAPLVAFRPSPFAFRLSLRVAGRWISRFRAGTFPGFGA